MLEAVTNEFIEDLRDRLRAEKPQLIADLPDDEALEQVRRLVERARQYGFSIKSVIFRFLVLGLEQAPDFDSPPLVRRLLLDATADERERISQTETYFAETATAD